MSNALELAKWHEAMAAEPKRNEAKRQKHSATAAELRRLAAVEAERDALKTEAKTLHEYKAWYEEAMAASNEAGYSGTDAASVIRDQDSLMALYERQRDALKAELDRIRAMEPVAWILESGDGSGRYLTWGKPENYIGTPLYTMGKP